MVCGVDKLVSRGTSGKKMWYKYAASRPYKEIELLRNKAYGTQSRTLTLWKVQCCLQVRAGSRCWCWCSRCTCRCTRLWIAIRGSAFSAIHDNVFRLLHLRDVLARLLNTVFARLADVGVGNDVNDANNASASQGRQRRNDALNTRPRNHPIAAVRRRSRSHSSFVIAPPRPERTRRGNCGLHTYARIDTLFPKFLNSRGSRRWCDRFLSGGAARRDGQYRRVRAGGRARRGARAGAAGGAPHRARVPSSSRQRQGDLCVCRDSARLLLISMARAAARCRYEREGAGAGGAAQALNSAWLASCTRMGSPNPDPAAAAVALPSSCAPTSATATATAPAPDAESTHVPADEAIFDKYDRMIAALTEGGDPLGGAAPPPCICIRRV